MSDLHLKPLYQTIDGIRFPQAFCPTFVKEALAYKAKPDDIFIVTYPKSGTTWMQNLAIHILRKGQPIKNVNDFMASSPFLEMLGEEYLKKMTHPGVIKTHLPYTHMPQSPDAKYIFVARNPKDVCVSLYHHTHMLPGYAYTDGDFDDFFELFIKGEVEYNDYFDHLISWFSHRNEKNVFYTTYEDMKKDIRDVALRLGSFLGKEYSEALKKDSNVLNNVIKFSSFQHMKETLEGIYDPYAHGEDILYDPEAPEGLKYLMRFTQSLGNPKKKHSVEFIRKGIVGDWKNLFSNEQKERLEQLLEKRNENTNIKCLWEHHNILC